MESLDLVLALASGEMFNLLIDDKDSYDNDNGGGTFNKLSYRRPGLRVGHLAATT